jgi:hypothetical protein
MSEEQAGAYVEGKTTALAMFTATSIERHVAEEFQEGLKLLSR